MTVPDPITALRESRAVAEAREKLAAYDRFKSGRDVTGDWREQAGKLADSIRDVLAAIDAAGGQS